MKKLMLCLGVVVAMAVTINAQIPNQSFENWSNGADEAPDGWSDHGSNHPGFHPATQTTDKYMGLYAVSLENKITSTDTTRGEIHTTRPNDNGGFGPAFPISTRYNNLKGYYKYAPLNGDSAQIIVYITKTGLAGTWGDLLAFGLNNLGAAATYTPFSIGYKSLSPYFLYLDSVAIPDSAYINIAAYKGLNDSVSDIPPLGNSVLIVDAISFDNYLEINESMDITNNFNLYPSVNNGKFDVKFETTENDFTTIKIYNLEGKEIIKLFSGVLNKGNHEFYYSVPQLVNGYYLYVVSSAKGYRSQKICIIK